MRLSEMKQKEVINIKDCSRLGFVGDVDIDICTGRVTALIIPGTWMSVGISGKGERVCDSMAGREADRGRYYSGGAVQKGAKRLKTACISSGSTLK